MSTTTCSSTLLPACTIPSELSQSSTSPSTAKPSIFNSADSVPSTSHTSPLPFTTVKRKHARDSQEVRPGCKRVRSMGRPKNAWTSTRLRKLARLYMFTNLKPIEIGKVLEARGFQPSKRDVQQHLNSLLQSRPNQIRPGTLDTRARLRILRDCRDLRKSRQASNLLQTERSLQEGINIESHNFQEATPDSVSGLADNISGYNSLWLDSGLDLGHEDPGPSLEQRAYEQLPTIQEDFVEMQAVDTTSLSSLLVGEYSGGIALFPLNDIQSQKTNHFYEKPLEKQDQDPVEGSTGPSLSIETSCSRPGPNIGLQSAEEMTANSGNYSSMFDWSLPSPNILSMDSDLTFLQSPAIPTLSISDSSSFNGPYVSVNSSESNGNNLESLQLATKSALEKVDRLVTESASLGDNLDTESLLPTRGRPSRESVLTMTSLNRRLSAKYTPSYLDDVMSLLEHHTISGSSTRNSEISSRRSSKSFLRQSEIRRGLTAMDEQPVLPVKVKPPVVLPGVFHTYCVAQINQNSLERCRHDGLLCEHTSPDTLRFFVSYLDSGKILYSRLEHRRINDVDRFGNSILHVAASLKAPVKYLIKLIKLKANINATNAAKETFLHLVVAPTQADDICLLLEILSRNSFNFGRHDQHGQTSLHVLTRPWLPRDYLIKVIRKVHSLGFVLPTSRDNLGFTLLNQMKHVGTHALGFDPDEDMAYRLSLGLTCHTQGYVVRPYDNKTVESSIVQRKHHHGKDEAQDFTHAMEDFQLKYHTDLLATIVTAGDKPWFEDSKGRNSLHCLAEVAIDVPKRNNPSPHTQLPENEICGDRNILRENYLEGLLAAGVNPNNYDKAGNTPLMAFIIHTRVEEDDDTTLRILNRLLDAKAGIHRRNRQGETALHLAIKLGRRAATKFLLQKGAHVYARNKKGMGILEVGLEACKKLGHDEALYSQILLSMSLVMSAGAVSSPTIVLEWSSWPKRISDVTNTMNL